MNSIFFTCSSASSTPSAARPRLTIVSRNVAAEASASKRTRFDESGPSSARDCYPRHCDAMRSLRDASSLRDHHLEPLDERRGHHRRHHVLLTLDERGSGGLARVLGRGAQRHLPPVERSVAGGGGGTRVIRIHSSSRHPPPPSPPPEEVSRATPPRATSLDIASLHRASRGMAGLVL